MNQLSVEDIDRVLHFMNKHQLSERYVTAVRIMCKIYYSIAMLEPLPMLNSTVTQEWQCYSYKIYVIIVPLLQHVDILLREITIFFYL